MNSVEVEIPDDATAHAVVVVYTTAAGLESSFRHFPESPISSDLCELAAAMALRNYRARRHAKEDEAGHE